MKTIWDYPVSFPYGATTKPYSPSNPHKGEDRAAPFGTPITVNSVVIGTVGLTGVITGPHLHVGKWLGGKHTNPFGGGSKFASAVVTEIHLIDDNPSGRFVRVQGDGFSWVYCHLESVNVKAGQVLKSGGEIVMTPEQRADWISKEHFIGYGTPAPDATFKSWGDLLKNNPIDGALTILTAIDGDPNALKNKQPAGFKPAGELFVKEG